MPLEKKWCLRTNSRSQSLKKEQEGGGGGKAKETLRTRWDVSEFDPLPKPARGRASHSSGPHILHADLPEVPVGAAPTLAPLGASPERGRPR